MDASTVPRRDDHIFLTLDGMRGVAAICVVVYHAYWLVPGLRVPGGYLAVDLFFVLSGFVLTHAYGARFTRGLRTRPFMAQRVLRLYPMYAIGTLLTGVGTAVNMIIGHGRYSWSEFGVIASTAAAMLPAPLFLSNYAIYPLNTPAWSLFYELLSNAIFVAVWAKLTRPRLMLLIIAGGVGMVGVIFARGDANVGYDWWTFLEGLPRVTFSFFLGVLLYRLHRSIRVGPGLAWLIPFALLPVFLATPDHRVLYEVFTVLLLLPTLVLVGASSEPSVAVGHLFRALGRISYPLYAIHEPLIRLSLALANHLHIDLKRHHSIVGILAIAAMCLLAWLLDRFVDGSARRLLRARLPRRVFA